jgi:hypothetical protein
MADVWASLPRWINPMTKDEKILNEGLENASEKQDNMLWISCLTCCIFIGCSPFLAKKIIA